MRKQIRNVLTKKYAALTNISKSALAKELFAAGFISSKVLNNLLLTTSIIEFVAVMSFKACLNELQEYLSNFLISLNKLGGSYAAASHVLQNEWTEFTKRQLNIKLHFTH